MAWVGQYHRNTLLQLRALDPNKKRAEFTEFQRFWGNTLDVVHFACHAFYEDKSPDMSYLLLSDEFDISIMDLVTYGVTINDNPLIIMTACETGHLNPLYTSYFAEAFLEHGVRGVVATECTVPDAFAADFAEQLYTHLLAGERLGTSLLITRRYFLGSTSILQAYSIQCMHRNRSG
jgi:CHAT domain-containing protein